jgi:hypothetical protein
VVAGIRHVGATTARDAPSASSVEAIDGRYGHDASGPAGTEAVISRSFTTIIIVRSSTGDGSKPNRS